MFLYIDLNKAQFVGVTTPNERRSSRSYAESYAKQPIGVLGGSAAYDRKDVGKEWHSGNEEAVDDELEEERKEYAQLSRDRGVTPKEDKKTEEVDEEEEEEINKAFLVDVVDSQVSVYSACTEFLKSLNQQLEQQAEVHKPRSSEEQYVTEVLGYDVTDIKKGLASISGRERGKFHDWLCTQLQKSVRELGE